MKKLFTAIRQGKLDEVKSMIEKKPELVNCVSGALPKKDHGQSPLQVAFKTGQYEIADFLIEHGADINFMETEDDDPGLRVPVLFDAINSTITSLCHERFDAINWSVSQAELLFERAGVYPQSQEAVRRQLTRILDLLIENGADYAAWAYRGHYPEPYPGPSNKSMFIGDFVPATKTDIDKKKELRAFMQEYFKTRKLHV